MHTQNSTVPMSTTKPNDTTGAAHQLATVKDRSFTTDADDTAHFRELWKEASPRLRKVTAALLELLTGKTIHAREGSRPGEPLTDTQRGEVFSLVLTELESLRADGFPCEDIEIILSEITKGGKRP